MDSEPAIQIEGLSQTFTTQKGDFLALRNIDLTVRQGEFVSVVGPSGCGKSSLLTIISGLARPRQGSAKVLGRPVDGVNRQVGFIFQRDALLPWRTALDNVALPLRFRGVGSRQAEKEAREWIIRVGLAGFESSYPHQLSGGMRKRVAIAATMVYSPLVVLMDEPFSALDVQTRNLMENGLLDIWSDTGQTVLFITHDLEEAIGLSDRVVVMSASPGHILANHEVPLNRPRDLLEDKLTPAFMDIYARIWQDLRAEVMRASEQEAGPPQAQ